MNMWEMSYIHTLRCLYSFFFFKASDYCLSLMIKTQTVRALYLGRYYSFWEAFSHVKILKPNLKYFHKHKWLFEGCPLTSLHLLFAYYISAFQGVRCSLLLNIIYLSRIYSYFHVKHLSGNLIITDKKLLFLYYPRQCICRSTTKPTFACLSLLCFPKAFIVEMCCHTQVLLEGNDLPNYNI